MFLRGSLYLALVLLLAKPQMETPFLHPENHPNNSTVRLVFPVSVLVRRQWKRNGANFSFKTVEKKSRLKTLSYRYGETGKTVFVSYIRFVARRNLCFSFLCMVLLDM